jgi:hypothetical protein
MSVPTAARSTRRLIAALGLTCAAFLFGGVPGASAALFTQCPPVGADDGCGSLITVNPDGTGSVASDPAQPAYEQSEDTLVGLQNNSPGTVSSVNLSSTLDIFGFDGDGICNAAITPQPAGCPFGPTEYEGPGTSFSNISADFTTGTVDFSPPVPSGGAAYWGLEEAITAADINLGTIAVQAPPVVPAQQLTCGTVSVGAAGYQPPRSLTPTVPGVRAFIFVSEPSQVDIAASLGFKGAAKSKSVSLGSFTLQDPGRKKLRIPLSKKLLDELSIGDRVNLNLSIKTTPIAAPRCASPESKNVSLKTRVVHILKAEHN